MAQVVNGSFEDGDTSAMAGNGLSVGKQSSALLGWKVRRSEVAWFANGNGHDMRASHGSRCLDISGYSDRFPGAVLSQVVPTHPGWTYRLTLDAGAQRQGGVASLRVKVRDADAAKTIASAIYNHATSSSQSVWWNHSVDFVATSERTELQFTPNNASISVGLDNVSLAVIDDGIGRVVNGSFEIGRYVNPEGDGTQLEKGTKVLTGWTVTRGELQWFANGVHSAIASEGERSLDLTGGLDAHPGAILSQIVPVKPDTSYGLSFDMGANYQSGTASILVKIFDVATGKVLKSGTVSHSSGAATTVWWNHTFDFVSKSDQIQIFFTSNAPGSVYVGLDNVDLREASPMALAREPDSHL